MVFKDIQDKYTEYHREAIRHQGNVTAIHFLKGRQWIKVSAVTILLKSEKLQRFY